MKKTKELINFEIDEKSKYYNIVKKFVIDNKFIFNLTYDTFYIRRKIDIINNKEDLNWIFEHMIFKHQYNFQDKIYSDKGIECKILEVCNGYYLSNQKYSIIDEYIDIEKTLKYHREQKLKRILK